MSFHKSFSRCNEHDVVCSTKKGGGQSADIKLTTCPTIFDKWNSPRQFVYMLNFKRSLDGFPMVVCMFAPSLPGLSFLLCSLAFFLACSCHIRSLTYDV